MAGVTYLIVIAVIVVSDRTFAEVGVGVGLAMFCGVAGTAG